MNLTFRQLRVFVAVAKHGSMVQAAAALHLTPPAVSLQIKEIETQVGVPLFIRAKPRLSLSPAGEHFLVYAKRLLATLKDADNAMAHFKQLDRGILTIGIVNTAEYFVPRLLALFHKDYPGAQIRIRVAASSEQLIALMDGGEVDLSVMTRLPKDIAVLGEKLTDNPYVFVCPTQHPLLGSSPVPVHALDEDLLLVREQESGTRATMERFLAGHRCAPQITMEIANNETIKQSVMAGIGLGFLPLCCIGLELNNGLLAVLNIADTPVLGTWNLVRLPSKILSPTADAFRHFIMEQGEKHMRAHNDMLLSLAFNGRQSSAAGHGKTRIAARNR